MYLLIPKHSRKENEHDRHLHSIMYLLIQASLTNSNSIPLKFTFHNVSINSSNGMGEQTCQRYLHSIMYLLILINNLFV